MLEYYKKTLSIFPFLTEKQRGAIISEWSNSQNISTKERARYSWLLSALFLWGLSILISRFWIADFKGQDGLLLSVSFLAFTTMFLFESFEALKQAKNGGGPYLYGDKKVLYICPRMICLVYPPTNSQFMILIILPACVFPAHVENIYLGIVVGIISSLGLLAFFLLRRNIRKIINFY